MRVGVLASGKLGFSIFQELHNRHDIRAVFTDSKSSPIIDFSNENKIPVFIGNPRNGKAQGFISQTEIDVLISVNYLFVVDKDVLEWPQKIAFNIHGSLLPKYRGRTPHVWAIINNEKETGITAHIMEEGLDNGDIIEQEVIPITKNETGGGVLEKFEELYLPLIERVLKNTANDTLVSTVQNEEEASYFGMRNPNDGMIDWSWQKERIRNWVRAQAYPYPGAFTFSESEKLVIDEITFSNHGFSSDMPNGLVLSEDPVIVKTPNGAVEIVRMRTTTSRILKGTLLNMKS